MKKTSKLLSFLLSLVLAINITIGVSPVNVNAAEANVAYVRVLACTEGLGHAFLVVTNKSSSSITVGKYSLPAGQTCTVGTFGNLEDGKCLYYNVEKYRMVNKYCNYKPNVGLGEYITSSKLVTLTNTINNNTKWKALKNCATFAETCWNSISSKNIKSGAIDRPAKLAKSIKKHSGYFSNYVLSGTCDISEVKYQSSKDAPIRNCSLKTKDKMSSSSSSSSN